MTARQVESLSRIDRILNDITKTFVLAQRDLLRAITGDYSEQAKHAAFPAIVRAAVDKTKQLMSERFAEEAKWAHDSAARAMMAAIPKPYLLSRIPEETRAAFEQIHYPRLTPNLNFETGTLSVSTEEVDAAAFNASIPISPLGKLDLSDEETEELIKKLVFPPPSEADVAAALNTPGWESRLESLSHRISDKQIAFDELVQGYAEGENITQIRKRIDPLVGGLRSSAQRIARTEGMRVAETMQRQAWDALGDMMVGVQIIAVLDANTRPEHATRNGTIYYTNPRGGQKSISELPDLPDAPNCRCMSTPVLKPPDELDDDPAIREAFKATKGAGTGDPETHTKWFKAATVSDRKKVVGVRRYNQVSEMIGKERQPDWSDFIDVDGVLLSVAQLLAESVIARMARKREIEKQIAKRGKAIREISDRGFEWPKDNKKRK